MSAADAAKLKQRGPFVNRGLQEWYTFSDPAFGGPPKGGTIDFLLSHPNPLGRASRNRWAGVDLFCGTPLHNPLRSPFPCCQALRYAFFCLFLPPAHFFFALLPDFPSPCFISYSPP